MRRSTIKTVAMQDANLELKNGSVVSVGAQGWHGITGFWEVFQLMVPPYDDYTHLSQWNIWHSDPSGVASLPERTLAVSVAFSVTKPYVQAVGDYGFITMESFWDKEATLLADRMTLRRFGLVDNAGQIDVMLSKTHHLFCPITASSVYGDNASGPASPSSYSLRQITIKLSKQVKGELTAFSDFEIQKIYLPSDNYNYLDKT